MEKYTFKEIKEDILRWFHGDMLKSMTQNDKCELSKNNNDILLLDLTFSNCLAQLAVSKPFWAPFQFVSFEAMTLDTEKAQSTGEPELVYFFCDSYEMTKKEVMNELELGVQYCSCYVPDQTRNEFFNKKGSLAIEYEKLRHIIHPDDIKKIGAENVRGGFVCKGMEAQYLVVENDMFLLRILPENFIVTS